MAKIVRFHEIGGPEVLKIENEAHRHLESNQHICKIVVTV
jgi:hypothetical protein